MSQSIDNPAPRPERTLRRTLVVTILIILSIVAVSGGMLWRRGAVEQARVNRLLRFDGTIYAYYDVRSYRPSLRPVSVGEHLTMVHGRGQRVHGFSVRDQPSRLPKLLEPIFGPCCFAQVTDVFVSGESFTDDDLELILGFPGVRGIELNGTSISDVGLTKLASLDQLEWLDVEQNKVTGQSLRQFAQCRNLKELSFDYTEVDPDTVDYLKKQLPNCAIYGPPRPVARTPRQPADKSTDGGADEDPFGASPPAGKTPPKANDKSKDDGANDPFK